MGVSQYSGRNAILSDQWVCSIFIAKCFACLAVECRMLFSVLSSTSNCLSQLSHYLDSAMLFNMCDHFFIHA